MVAAVPSGTGTVGFILAVALCAFASAPAPAHAADHGATLPIATFLAEQMSGEGGAMASDMLVQFPVSTPGFEAGRLSQRARLSQPYPTWLSNPIALVADDADSRAWLTQQSSALQVLGATILVVRVASKANMGALRAQYPDLAMSASVLPDALVQSLRLVQSAKTPLVIMTDGSLVQDVRPAAAPRMNASRNGGGVR
jgi:integrating conjugative element protein (TIGR03765 family)